MMIDIDIASLQARELTSAYLNKLQIIPLSDGGHVLQAKPVLRFASRSGASNGPEVEVTINIPLPANEAIGDVEAAIFRAAHALIKRVASISEQDIHDLFMKGRSSPGDS